MSSVLKRWRDWLPLLVILCIGAGLRLYRIGELPPGLYRDEAFYGLDALGVLRGDLAVFFAANNGREGLFMYLLAGSINLFGRTPMALRIVSAVCGILTILAIYAAGRNLFSHRIGVLSAGILAVTFWHLAISRVAYRAITLPLLLCVTIALGALLARRVYAGDGRRCGLIALSFGVAFGLTLYTYTSAQFLAVLALAFVVCALMVKVVRPTILPTLVTSRSKRALMITVSAALLALAPLLFWLSRHAGIYFARAGQVSILSPVINHGDLLGTLWLDIQKAIGMFAYQGDRIWRHNLALLPVFEGVLATAFFVGVGVCLWRVVRKPTPMPMPSRGTHVFSALLMVLWLCVFLAPTILAEDTPHYLRAIGALPAACILAAVGLESLLAWLSRRGLLNYLPAALARRISPPALIAALALAVSAGSTATQYFDVYVHSDTTAYWLEAQNTALAKLVNAFPTDHPASVLWLQDRIVNDNPALRFLSPMVDHEQATVVGEGKPAPIPADNVVLVVDPNHDWTALRNELPAPVLLRVSEGPLAQADLERNPRRAYITVMAQKLAGYASNAAEFEQGIILRQAQFATVAMSNTGDQLPLTAGATSMSPGATPFTLTLFWSNRQPIPTDNAVFVHVWRNGNVIAQDDSSPAQNYLPMPTWRPGDVIADAHMITVNGGLKAGDEVRVGIYKRGENVRLRVLDSKGSLSVDSVLVLRVTAAE